MYAKHGLMTVADLKDVELAVNQVIEAKCVSPLICPF